MKRRVINRLLWPWSEHWKLYATLSTELGCLPVVIRSISIQQIWTKGRREGPQQGLVNISFEHTRDKLKGHIAQKANELSRDGIEYQSESARDAIFTFQPNERGDGFCEEAIRKLVIILEKFGVKKSDLKPPRVSQETLVWISNPNSATPNHKYWCEYGSYLAMKEGLAPF